MRLHVPIVLSASVSLLGILAACSGGGSGGPGPDGGQGLPDGGQVLPDGAVVQNPGDGGACPTAPVRVIEANAGSLDVSGDEVVFLDRSGGNAFGNAKTRSIRKVRLDGTGAVELYAPPAGRRINDLKTVGTTAFFLESEFEPVGNKEETSLFSLPITGGAPTLIAKHSDPTGPFGGGFAALNAIVAVTGTHVFAVRGGPADDALWRITITGGAQDRIYAGQIKTRPQLAGEELYFASGDVPAGEVNYTSVVKVAASGAGGIVAVGGAKCGSNMTAATFGILCVGASETGAALRLRAVSKWDLAGGGHAVLFEGPESRVTRLGPSDGTQLYVHPEKGDLRKVPVAGGASSIVACGRQTIPLRGAAPGEGVNRAVGAGLDMVLTPSELVWTEARKEAEGGPETIAIYRTPR